MSEVSKKNSRVQEVDLCRACGFLNFNGWVVAVGDGDEVEEGGWVVGPYSEYVV